MDIETILDTLKSACCKSTLDSSLGLGGEVFVTLDPDQLRTAVRALLAEHHVHHLSTLTALNRGTDVEVLYHFWGRGGLTLRVCCPRENPTLASIVDLIPAADWYEREVHDLFGLEFVGHPDLSHLLLPDDWDGPPPLLNTGEEE